MSGLEFHHVGVGTVLFEAAIATYVDLGYKLVTSVDDEALDVRIAFLSGPSGPLLEIVSPLGPDGPLRALLKKQALPSPYHTCYATRDLLLSGEMLRSKGFLQLGPPRPAAALGNAPITYHYHHAIGLLELVENPRLGQ
ncbi:MAG: VOC family protein [Gammaproteobacteria bacterium]|nr:VOC family protein [Gammaproteobacteria bacterium]MBU1624002.1 VOC family protein [Gammaproteobacteria bacterium]MBU1981730.1 VOC family protein [Gammaproteobacteria bacterium]